MKKILGITLTLILILGLFTGCASRSEGTSSMMVAPEPEYDRASGETYDMAVTEEAAVESMDYDDEAYKDNGVSSNIDADAIVQQTERKLIYQAYYSIETTEFDADYAFILDTLESVNGYAQSASVNGTRPTEYGDYGRNADLYLRIPVERYNDFLAALEGVGNITSKSQYTDDVSAQYIDVESRINILTTQLDQLNELMTQAKDMEDIIVLKQEISDVMYELEQFEGQKRQLDNLIDYTTITIYLSEVNEISTISASEKGLSERIGDNFSNVFDGLVRFGEGLVIFIVAGSPVWILIGILVFVIIRISKRKKVKKETEKKEKK